MKTYDYILYAKNFDGYKEILYFASDLGNKESSLENIPKSKNIIYVFDLSEYNFDDTFSIDEEYKELVSNGYDCYLGVDFQYYPCEVGLYPMIKDKYRCLIIDRVKYLSKDDKEASDVLEAILTNSSLKEETLFDLGVNISFNLKTKDEFMKSYASYKELLQNLNEFINSINIEIEYSDTLPKYIGKDDTPSDVFLRALAYKGLKKRLQNTSKDQTKYKERLNYELDVIHKMGFDDYFLVVYDYILYAKKNGIYVGPGRGSAASSLVSYSLGIVDIDPLEYGLYFERFLNPERKTMPDIDTDFEDNRRDDVIRYVREKYGEYHVSLISTFQTFLAKSCIRDVSKILEIPDEKINLISKEISDTENSIESLMKSKNIKRYYDSDDDYKRILDISKRIEGLPRSIGTHAAGVIISNSDLREYSEIHMGQNGFLQTMYDSDSLKDIGLLKMDFLALKNLSIIHDIINDIEKYEGKKVSLPSIRLDDKDTYLSLQTKSTMGIFQLESPGITDLLRKMKVKNINDLALCIALYRPGPMDQIPEYLRRRNGKAKIDYYDKSIEDILIETLGIIVYQEQTMAIVSRYAGLSLAYSDIVRRAMSSKDESLIDSIKDTFYKSSKDNGRDDKTTDRLFNDIKSFAGYGFNKAHAISYSYITYYLSYLKTHFPPYFMSNLLKNSSSPKYIKECMLLGIKVCPPDARFSGVEYMVHDNNIYMPYTEIKGIGRQYAKDIVSLLKEANYDFIRFVKLSKDSLPRGLIEDLIYSNTFDYTGYNKNTLIQSLDGLFEFDSDFISGLSSKISIQKEYSFEYLKEKEFDLLGINFNYHPIKAYKGMEKKISDIDLSDQQVRIVAYIRGIKQIKTKNNTFMAQMFVEDEFKSVRAVIFSKDYLSVAHILQNNNLYILDGTYKMDDRGEEEFIIRSVTEVNG